MGICSSGPKDSKDQKVARELQDAQAEQNAVKKLLLLGAGGSGKSTFFKQLTLIHTEGYSVNERLGYKSQIFEQMIHQMKTIVERCQDDDPQFESCKIGENAQEAVKTIQTARFSGADLDSDLADVIATLWADEGIQKMYSYRAKICVFDSSGFFFSKAKEVVQDDYIPTDDDILAVRHRTTGMNERDIVIEGTHLRIVDVGGQRSERRKWIHFFDGVTAVLFVTSLSCYDEVLFEDENVNVMDESLGVFEENINSHWFAETAFILFLNKEDLFREKIEKVPLTECWPDYDGPQDAVPCLDYIKQQFEARNKNPDERSIYTHVTTATNQENVIKVFNDVQHIVVDRSLQQAGLL